MFRRVFILMISLILLLLASCNSKEGSVEEAMYEVVENGEMVEIEPLDNVEIDAKERLHIEEQLTSIVAKEVNLDKEATLLSVTLHDEPSCSIVLPTDSSIEREVIQQVKQTVIKQLENNGVTLNEKNIVITDKNGNVMD